MPTLLYMLVIGPLTQYFLSWTWGSGGFGHQWLRHLRNGEWLSETGPMWFCAALLVFSILYGLLRCTGWREPQVAFGDDRPSRLRLAGFIAAMAAFTFLVRIRLDEGASVLNVHPGNFPQYVLMFVAATLGYRGNWLVGVPQRFCVRMGSLALAASLPLIGARILFAAGFRATRNIIPEASTGSAPANACGRRWSASAGAC